MPNTSGQARRSCYSLYRSSETRGSLTEGRNPTWPPPVSATPSFVRLRIIAWDPFDSTGHKCDVLGRQGGSRAGLSEATLRRLDREGKLGLQRRRILGLPDTGTGGDE